MAITNAQRVSNGLDLLVAGLAPFIEREMQSVHGNSWKDEAEKSLKGDLQMDRKKRIRWDTSGLLVCMWDQWHVVFSRTLGHAERSLVSELREWRNRWAHQHSFSYQDTYRVLDSVSRLLSAVSAGEQAQEVEKAKMELLRVQFDEQRRVEERKAVTAPIEGSPTGNLKPWREVVTPHPDVASGRYQQAEFAADLWQVYMGQGTDEYKDPAEFFQRTFLTDGLKRLLTQAILRLSGSGGDPVVELQTNFGGGKTHSMLALYHLFSGASPNQLSGVENLVKDASTPVPGDVKRAVIVGTKISPGQTHKKSDGTVVRTLWGEIAWQLGGKQGYKMVADADRTSTNPGDAIREVFDRYSPCLILIDEWVAYARQLHEDPTLPAGTFDTQFTFAQTLTEAAKAAGSTLLVISIPASESPSPQPGHERISDIEVGGERGRAALARLKNAIGRVEASWRPASQDEGFEIVRRRLFEPIREKQAFVDRDQVARAFVDMYGSTQKSFPSECKEAGYRRRIEAAYPIHPELFDRLYNDWSTLEKFQRTRGVLRLMAAVIHSLWDRDDNNLLIMPATVPIDDSRVQFELTRYLEEQWVPVLEKDVDGPHSLPVNLDRENPAQKRYSACRRVARCIYMGSAPIQKAANRGVEENQILLGCVQPGESVPTFGDALRRLTDRATYLYVDGRRYWYSTQPTVSRLAEDRAGQYHDSDIAEAIHSRLRSQQRQRGDFHGVHACVSSADIPDDPEARLVILGTEYPHSAKNQNSDALQEAKSILDLRGNSPRQYTNTLVFLAPDSNRLEDLKNAVRQHMAWTSIWEEREQLNLDAFQSKQAQTKCQDADHKVEVQIPETFQWLLVPTQPDPKGNVEWTETRQSGAEALATRVSKKLRNEELLITEMGGLRLRHELDRIPLWRGNHVPVKQLAEDFAKYLYLPRLRDKNVLIGAIEDGLGQLDWDSSFFGYAADWDENKKRYVGLQGGKSIRVISDSKSLLVKPDVAATQLTEEEKAKGPQEPIDKDTEKLKRPDVPPQPPAQPVFRRFHGTVRLDSMRIARDAGKIAEEVAQHLTSIVGAKVYVTLEISAELPDGATDKTVRDVTENCRTLKFSSYSFEEE